MLDLAGVVALGDEGHPGALVVGQAESQAVLLRICFPRGTQELPFDLLACFEAVVALAKKGSFISLHAILEILHL